MEYSSPIGWLHRVRSHRPKAVLGSVFLYLCMVSLGCGSFSEDCTTYCDLMTGLDASHHWDATNQVRSAAGHWACYGVNRSGGENESCSIVIPIHEADTYDHLEDPGVITLPLGSPICEPIDGYDNSTDAVDSMSLSKGSRYDIYNPPDRATCVDRCEISTGGDSMSNKLMDDIQQATDAYDFLQAQMRQQCRSLAAEVGQ